MSANPQQPYDSQKDKRQIFPTYNVVTQSQFVEDGHPGKWNRSVTVIDAAPNSGSIVDFTGSNFGASALILVSATTNATASLSAGGEIKLGGMPTGIHELGISQVTSRDLTNPVYVLINTESV